MHVRSRIQTSLKLILAVAFALAPLNSYAAPPTAANDNYPPRVAANDNLAAANDNNQQQSFLTTENIPTTLGPAHLEVQTYTIRNEAELTRAKNEILAKLRANPKTHDQFRLNVVTSDHLATNLDTSTRVALDQIESNITSAHKGAAQNITVAPPDKAGFFKRHYNLTLSFVRFIANSGVVSTGLIMGAGVAAPHALMIGVLAGAMSGAIQLKSDVLMKWLSNSVLLVNAAKRLGLLKPTEGANPSRVEHVMKEMEMYGRWATLEAAFLIVVQTSMALLNIPVHENLLGTVAKSTASQGVYEVGVLKLANHLESLGPGWAAKAAVFKNVSLFAGSGVSVLAAIGSMVGMPFANLGFVTLTTAGLMFTFGPKLMRTNAAESLIQGWRRLTAPAVVSRGGSCRALFQ